MNFGSDEPIYLQLAKSLTREILSGRLPAGAKLTERWIAQEYKVARWSVPNALHLLGAQGLVHRISPRKIVVADVEVDQRRHPGVPIILVRDRRYPLADASIPDSWYGEIRAGIRATAKDMGCCVHEEALADSFKVPLQEYVPPRPGEVGGVVLCGTYDEQYIEMFRSERVPLVLVDYWAHNPMTDYVCVDVEAEAHMIVDLLAGKGHASLGFLAMGRPSREGAPSYEYDPDIYRMLEYLRAASRSRLELRDEWCLGARRASVSPGGPRLLVHAAAAHRVAVLQPPGSRGGSADRHEDGLAMSERLFAGRPLSRTRRGTRGHLDRD